MVRAQRTVNPLHFEDLEPHRFEDLVRQLAYTFRTWRYLDATGRLGRDNGLDIRGVELASMPSSDVEPDRDDEDPDPPLIDVEERTWSIQCKRYKEIGPKLMGEIVEETLPTEAEAPYGLIIAAACDVSADTMSVFRAAAAEHGVAEAHLWTKAHLEDLLFQPHHDHLLFAYFDISLGIRRQSRLQRIRHDIALKRKLLRAFGQKDIHTQLDADVLIRDVEDTRYPYEDEISGFFDLDVPPWHVAMIDQFYGRSLLVSRYRYQGWVKEDGSWDLLTQSKSIDGGMHTTEHDYWQPARSELFDQPEALALLEQVPEQEKKQIRQCSVLRFDNILEVDPIGDPLHPGTHLYCRYDSQYGPYDDSDLYITTDLWHTQIDVLDPDNRADLFTALASSEDAPTTGT